MVRHSRYSKEALPTVIPKALHLTGETGKLAENISAHWLIGLDDSNPAILTMFRDRDVLPYRDLLPWSGEFAGKHITGAYYVYMLTRDPALYDDMTRFIDRMLEYQDTDGYLGCFARDCRLTGAFSQNPLAQHCTWDAWNHYHIMYGLYLWYGLTGYERYRTALLNMADLFLARFYDGKPTLASIGSTEMNLAPFHIFAILYRMTGEEKYLYFAKKIEGDISSDEAGDYIGTSLAGIDFFECPKPRWESLHVILGIAEMYLSTGESYYLTSAEQITRSILRTDVHNTGAFSTDEQAIGNPYRNSNIETCCVVAYNALVIRMVNILGDLSLIDFLERSHYNAMLGSFSPSGKWSTYSSPMDGEKCANYHAINFHCRPGSPQLNCCSVNAPRGVGEVISWMFTGSGDALCLNFYESFEAELNGFKIACEGNYPAPGDIRLHVTGTGQLRLRIPGWSKASTVTVSGKAFTPSCGTYFSVPAELLSEDTPTEIVLSFDFSPRLEQGEMECEGKTSICSGALLYGAESARNPELDLRFLPTLKMSDMSALPEVQPDGAVTWRIGDITLTDFYHLGCDGSPYRTWLVVE